MQTEVEAKFLNINHDTVRPKLRRIGAARTQPMRLMKRKNYDFPDGRLRKIGGWARVRDEIGKVTLSYKQLHDRTLHGTHEVSMEVSDFDAADAFLQAIGLAPTSYQETRRESWQLNGVEIELDEWPWVRPYVEMEGVDESGLRDIAGKLGLDWTRAAHGSVEVVYRGEFDVTDDEFCAIKTITFDEPVPAWLEQRRHT